MVVGAEAAVREQGQCSFVFVRGPRWSRTAFAVGVREQFANGSRTVPQNSVPQSSVPQSKQCIIVFLTAVMLRLKFHKASEVHKHPGLSSPCTHIRSQLAQDKRLGALPPALHMCVKRCCKGSSSILRRSAYIKPSFQLPAGSPGPYVTARAICRGCMGCRGCWGVDTVTIGALDFCINAVLVWPSLWGEFDLMGVLESS